MAADLQHNAYIYLSTVSDTPFIAYDIALCIILWLHQWLCEDIEYDDS